MFEDEEREAILWLLGISCLGGVVKWARKPAYGTISESFWGFLTCVATAAFVGLLAHSFMTWLNVDLSLQFAVSGAAGYGGGMLLDAAVPFLVRIVYKKAGLDYEQAGREENYVE